MLTRYHILRDLRNLYENRVLICTQDIAFDIAYSENIDDIIVSVNDTVLINKIVTRVNTIAPSHRCSHIEYHCEIIHNFKSYNVVILSYNYSTDNKDHFNWCLNAMNNSFLISERID